jgi:DNA-directed RNA polymerase specialized sigma24 family protein
MNGQTVPSRQRELQEQGLSVPTITVGVTYFFPNERKRKSLGGAHSLVKREQEQSAIFAQRFLRSYRLLNFIASRVLGNEEIAPIAVQNCWRTASRNPPHFEYEGAFRSWLVRVLIDEALAILHESQGGRFAAATDVNAVSSSDSTEKPGLG